MAVLPERIAICALTFRRPAGLERLLDNLDKLTVPPGAELSVMIVDNDEHGSARAQLERRSGAFAHPLRYHNETARGISGARNAAVRLATAWGAEVVCFIDDDEWPDPEWLVELVRTRDATGAAIITGPVFPVFDEQPPTWVTEGGFFERRRHDHHERIRYATTSTVMISAACFHDRPEPFDLEFGLSGGEDTHLFAQLRDDGYEIVWCDRAHVFEAIPSSRVSTSWLLRREFRRGQTLSLSLRRRHPTPTRYARRLANASVQITSGLARAVVGAPFGRATWLAGIEQCVFGAGMLSGLAGRRYEEYVNLHGS